MDTLPICGAVKERAVEPALQKISMQINGKLVKIHSCLTGWRRKEMLEVKPKTMERLPVLNTIYIYCLRGLNENPSDILR